MLWLRRIAFAIAIVIAVIATVWSAAALYFDSPFPLLRAPAAVLYLIVVLVACLVCAPQPAIDRSICGLRRSFCSGGSLSSRPTVATGNPTTPKPPTPTSMATRSPSTTSATATIAPRPTTPASGKPAPTTWRTCAVPTSSSPGGAHPGSRILLSASTSATRATLPCPSRPAT